MLPDRIKIILEKERKGEGNWTEDLRVSRKKEKKEERKRGMEGRRRKKEEMKENKKKKLFTGFKKKQH